MSVVLPQYWRMNRLKTKIVCESYSQFVLSFLHCNISFSIQYTNKKLLKQIFNIAIYNQIKCLVKSAAEIQVKCDRLACVLRCEKFNWIKVFWCRKIASIQSNKKKKSSTRKLSTLMFCVLNVSKLCVLFKLYCELMDVLNLIQVCKLIRTIITTKYTSFT